MVTPKTNPFWDYSLKVYCNDDVKKLCLLHQENYDANVNLLLFCMWCGLEKSKLLLSDELVELHTLLDPWHNQVTKSLRSARQWLKKQAMKQKAIETYRQSILKNEIESEHIQQNILHQWYDSKNHEKNTQYDPGQTAIMNINNYYQSNKVSYSKQLAKAIEKYVDCIRET